MYTELVKPILGPGELESPRIYLPNALASPHLQFRYHMYGRAIDSLQVGVKNQGQFTRLGSILGEQQKKGNDPWRLAEFNLSSFINDTVQIVFKAYAASVEADLAIDNFSILSQTCPKLDTFYSPRQTTTSIDLKWSSPSSQFQLQYGPSGFELGNGTTQGLATDSVSVQGLSPNTRYDFYIRRFCGVNLSQWFGPLQVSPLCSTMTAPAVIDFEQGFAEGLYATNNYAQIAPCWERNVDQGFFWGGGTDSTETPGTGPYVDHSTGLGNYVYVEGSGGVAGDTAILTSPYINTSGLNAPALRFWLHMESQGASPNLRWEVEQNGQWFPVDSIQGSQPGAWNEVISDLSQFPQSPLRIRFISVKPSGQNSAQSDIAIDEFSVGEGITCNVRQLPYAENFDSSTWQKGTNSANENDSISPCWSRTYRIHYTWRVDTGNYPNAYTGPSSDVSGSGNYIYLEYVGYNPGFLVNSPWIYIDSINAMPQLHYHYHMHGPDIDSLKVKVHDGQSTQTLRTFHGAQHTSAVDPWSLDSIDLSAYRGDTVQISFHGFGSGSKARMAIDEIEIKDTLSYCAAPDSLLISNLGMRSATITWSGGPSNIRYFNVAKGPSSAINLNNASSPLTLRGLDTNATYRIGLSNTCRYLTSAFLVDSFQTSACAPVQLSASYQSSFLGVQFNALQSLNTDSLAWDFGDGSSGNGLQPFHNYSRAGSYLVRLFGSNVCGYTDTTSFSINLCDTLKPRINIGLRGDSLFFDAGFSGANSWQWSFGDGAISSDSVGYHVFADTGLYDVRLLLLNACGDSLIYQKNLRICLSPVADWTYTVLSPVGSGLRVQFDASLSRNAIRYDWDFDDGSTDTGVAPIHTFNPPGLYYKVSLMVHNDCGEPNEKRFALNELKVQERDFLSLELSPNPFRDQLRLSWKDSYRGQVHVKMINSAGQVVKAVHWSLKDALHLNTAELPPGFYWLSIESEASQSNRQKLLKVD